MEAGYASAVVAELRFHEGRSLGSLDTVYLGGGTPSLLSSAALVQILDTVERVAPRVTAVGEPAGPRGRSPAARPSEVTVEASPESVSEELLAALTGAGVTRLSIGIQSFSREARQVLGRRVSDEATQRACDLAAGAGFADWNLDLVFGIPGQTWEGALEDLRRAVATGAPHLSLYDLTYTPRFEAWVARRLGPDAQRRAKAFAERHYRRAVEFLETQGYGRYEVSNFARPGHECRHNLAYWQGKDYVGVGAGAVSTVEGVRWTNTGRAQTYASRWLAEAGRGPAECEVAGRELHDTQHGGSAGGGLLPPSADVVEPLDAGTRLYERAMLGLRTREGVELQLILPVLDVRRTQALIQRGLVEEQCGTLTLSAGGLDVCNAVLSAILVPPGAAVTS